MRHLSTSLPAAPGAARIEILNRRMEGLRALAEIQSLLASSDVGVDDFMQIVVDSVHRLLPGRGAVVELVDGEEMVYRAVSEGYARHLGLRLPRAGSLSGLCVDEAAILVCEDSETDPRVDRDACRRVGLRSMVCAPLFDGELAVGVLKAMAGEAAAFDIEEIELLRHMSQTLGAAIATRVGVSDLRRLLQERTAALERVERRNQRLAQLTLELADAKHEAEAANRAKSEFLAAMSHELRTPLNGLVGFSELLARDALSGDERGRYRGFVRDAAKALLAIVDDILDLSRVEAGKLMLEDGVVAPARLIDSCAAMARPDAEAKGLALNIAIAPETPEAIAGDPTRLRQVLLNLLTNAVKFTATGGVTVSVAPADGERLRVTLADTGPGIAPEAQARLFQPFSQVDSTIHRRYGGTGLGLAICKRLVELMGGTIGVDSAVGEGSTFWFQIPARPADRPAEDDPPGLVAKDEALRILVVDDAEMNRALAEAVLRSADHAVDCVDGGAAGVEAVRSQAYDVVLMDVRMPGMDGLAATRAIRALPFPACATPILALTANAVKAEIDACLAAGMDGHVAKPIDIGALLTRVRDAARLSRPRR